MTLAPGPYAPYAPAPQQAPPPPPPMIRPLQLVNILLRGRWIIVGITLLAAAATSAYVLSIPPTYSATAKFMPSQGASASARMGAIAGPSGGVADFANESTAPEYYTTLLTSRALLEKLLAREFNVPSMGGTVALADTLGTDAPGGQQRERAIEALQKRVAVSSVRMKSNTPRRSSP